MHVTGDRQVEHGLATTGWDDEGVAAQTWDLVRDGTLVGYQLDRRIAAATGAGRSNGCAFGDSPLHVPIQRMANVSLQPAADGPDTAGLITGVEDGIFVVGDKSWSIDMQRYNFQFTGQRFYRIKGGRLAGMLRDVAYQATTTDFWGSMDAVGGPQTYVLGGAINCGKGQPGADGAGEPRVPVGAVPVGTDPQHRRGGRGMTPQEAVERALAASGTDDCVVIASVTHAANVRWANNTLTTNGVTRSNDVTVVSITGGREPRVASLSRTGVDADALDELVAASARAAADSPPADDAAPLVAAEQSADWAEPPGETAVAALGSLAAGLAASFEQARSRGEGRYGYAQHAVTTTYVGSSTGLRLRDVQGDGRVELTGRSDDGSRSAWAGARLARAEEHDVASLESDVAQRLDWSRRRVEVDAGRYDTILPPSAVADLMIDAYWSMGALDAHEGRTVYSRPGGGTRVGETLTDVPLTLRSDPALPGQECTPFVVAGASSRLSSVFDNGLALPPVSWIDSGRLAALLQTRHSAAVTGLATTPFVDNLVLESPDGAGDGTDLVRGTDRGLLLTCLWYIREVDPQTLLLTGLTRDGVFLVEGGEVVGAATNFRFNESPVGLLRRVTAVGATQDALAREFGDYFTMTRMPALRVHDFNMSSVSQAS